MAKKKTGYATHADNTPRQGKPKANGANLGFDELVQRQLNYIEHYTLWRDLTLLLRSVSAILSGRGAY